MAKVSPLSNGIELGKGIKDGILSESNQAGRGAYGRQVIRRYDGIVDGDGCPSTISNRPPGKRCLGSRFNDAREGFGCQDR